MCTCVGCTLFLLGDESAGGILRLSGNSWLGSGWLCSVEEWVLNSEKVEWSGRNSIGEVISLATFLIKLVIQTVLKSSPIAYLFHIKWDELAYPRRITNLIKNVARLITSPIEFLPLHSTFSEFKTPSMEATHGEGLGSPPLRGFWILKKWNEVGGIQLVRWLVSLHF
jgi:hypothetical protein